MKYPLILSGISKHFPPLPAVVKDLSFQLESGELLTLLGPSGCGKTTTLRLIAGLEQPDSGSLRIAGREMNGVPPEKRGVGLVFQEYALFPHLNVLHNVMFGLVDMSREQRLERAREVLSIVGLAIFETRMPHELSGGQQQRVALARALAPRPALLLLDEPFSNLDARLRQTTRTEVRQILRKTGTAALLVTHDQEEALAVSDRIALMRSGKIEQIGTPREVYCHPRTAFVAHFLGQSNLISGVSDGQRAETILGHIPLNYPTTPHKPVTLSLRPEELKLLHEQTNEGVLATISNKQFAGRDTLYTVMIGQTEILVLDTNNTWKESSAVRVKVAGKAHVVEAEE